ncbi:hypothetical protein BGZ63DRAFT_405980 [Mariannaea sp. PMI_226]|nr:hypothetical protein BGZ63DRAFT_405980 [Mariannaea sp. PMI_226]
MGARVNNRRLIRGQRSRRGWRNRRLRCYMIVAVVVIATTLDRVAVIQHTLDASSRGGCWCSRQQQQELQDQVAQLRTGISEEIRSVIRDEIRQVQQELRDQDF